MPATQYLFFSSALMTVAVLLSACSSSDTSDPMDELIAAPTLVWSACEGSETLECSRLKVPLDYSQPADNTLELALARLPASSGQAAGAVVFNPGGPGSSGVALVSALERMNLPELLTERFDIVGFDPRGVGGSRPVNCAEFGEDDLDLYPTTPAAVRNLEQQLNDYIAACQQKYGDYLLHLGSNNVARDMDKIRLALGQDKLRFVGYSYGTRLASLYAQLFPAEVGALVLDGAMPPEGGMFKLSRDAMLQMQANLLALLQSCTLDAAPCDDAQLLTQIEQRITFLLTEDHLEELDLFGDLLMISVQDPEIGEIVLPALRAYVELADLNVLEQFLAQFESITGEALVESDDSVVEEDSFALQTAVLCADDPVRPTVDEIIGLLEPFNASSDLFAEVYVSEAGRCMGWPASIDPLQPVTTGVDAPVLVIGGTSDAETPLIWSREMAMAMESALIVSDHAGHTVTFKQTSDCVDQRVIEVLVDGQVSGDAECNAN